MEMKDLQSDRKPIGEGYGYWFDFNSVVVWEDGPGRAEALRFRSGDPVGFVTGEPKIDEVTGQMTIPLEILGFSVLGESKELWPGQAVRMRGGIESYPDAKPIHGRVVFPSANHKLEDGVLCQTVVFVRIETPDGNYVNDEPVIMEATIRAFPPKDYTFTSQSATTFRLEGSKKGRTNKPSPTKRSTFCGTTLV